MALPADKWREIPGWPGHYERINQTPPDMARPDKLIDEALRQATSEDNGKGAGMKTRQWIFRPRGWFVLLTIGGAWGLGFMARSIRYNGADFYFGPVVLTVQPPMPDIPTS